jgi:hypothetical protein
MKSNSQYRSKYDGCPILKRTDSFYEACLGSKTKDQELENAAILLHAVCWNSNEYDIKSHACKKFVDKALLIGKIRLTKLLFENKPVNGLQEAMKRLQTYSSSLPKDQNAPV